MVAELRMTMVMETLVTMTMVIETMTMNGDDYSHLVELEPTSADLHRHLLLNLTLQSPTFFT